MTLSSIRGVPWTWLTLWGGTVNVTNTMKNSVRDAQGIPPLIRPCGHTCENVVWGAGAFMTVYVFKTNRNLSFLAILGCFLALAGALHQIKWKLIKNHLNPTQRNVVLGAWAFMTVYGFKTIRNVSFLAKLGPFQVLAWSLHQLKWKLIKNHLNPTQENVVLGAGAFMTIYGSKTIRNMHFWPI